MGRKENLDIVRRAYEKCFTGSGDADIVLADLEHECLARIPTFDPGSVTVTAYNEGKRAIWLRIQNTLNMSADDIERLAERAKLYFEEDI
ncbi:MAG: hypothetical protein V3R16_02390 [Nitrospirales bacterium]